MEDRAETSAKPFVAHTGQRKPGHLTHRDAL